MMASLGSTSVIEQTKNKKQNGKRQSFKSLTKIDSQSRKIARNEIRLARKHSGMTGGLLAHVIAQLYMLVFDLTLWIVSLGSPEQKVVTKKSFTKFVKATKALLFVVVLFSFCSPTVGLECQIDLPGASALVAKCNGSCISFTAGPNEYRFCTKGDCAHWETRLFSGHRVTKCLVCTEDECNKPQSMLAALMASEPKGCHVGITLANEPPPNSLNNCTDCMTDVDYTNETHVKVIYSCSEDGMCYDSADCCTGTRCNSAGMIVRTMCYDGDKTDERYNLAYVKDVQATSQGENENCTTFSTSRTLSVEVSKWGTRAEDRFYHRNRAVIGLPQKGCVAPLGDKCFAGMTCVNDNCTLGDQWINLGNGTEYVRFSRNWRRYYVICGTRKPEQKGTNMLVAKGCPRMTRGRRSIEEKVYKFKAKITAKAWEFKDYLGNAWNKTYSGGVSKPLQTLSASLLFVHGIWRKQYLVATAVALGFVGLQQTKACEQTTELDILHVGERLQVEIVVGAAECRVIAPKSRPVIEFTYSYVDVSAAILHEGYIQGGREIDDVVCDDWCPDSFTNDGANSHECGDNPLEEGMTISGEDFHFVKCYEQSVHMGWGCSCGTFGDGCVVICAKVKGKALKYYKVDPQKIVGIVMMNVGGKTKKLTFSPAHPVKIISDPVFGSVKITADFIWEGSMENVILVSTNHASYMMYKETLESLPGAWVVGTLAANLKNVKLGKLHVERGLKFDSLGDCDKCGGASVIEAPAMSLDKLVGLTLDSPFRYRNLGSIGLKVDMTNMKEKIIVEDVCPAGSTFKTITPFTNVTRTDYVANAEYAGIFQCVFQTKPGGDCYTTVSSETCVMKSAKFECLKEQGFKVKVSAVCGPGNHKIKMNDGLTVAINSQISNTMWLYQTVRGLWEHTKGVTKMNGGSVFSGFKEFLKTVTGGFSAWGGFTKYIEYAVLIGGVLLIMYLNKYVGVVCLLLTGAYIYSAQGAKFGVVVDTKQVTLTVGKIESIDWQYSYTMGLPWVGTLPLINLVKMADAGMVLIDDIGTWKQIKQLGFPHTGENFTNTCPKHREVWNGKGKVFAPIGTEFFHKDMNHGHLVPGVDRIGDTKDMEIRTGEKVVDSCKVSDHNQETCVVQKNCSAINTYCWSKGNRNFTVAAEGYATAQRCKRGNYHKGMGDLIGRMPSDYKYTWNRGHILAARLGGQFSSYNVWPQHIEANQEDTMIEGEVALEGGHYKNKIVPHCKLVDVIDKTIYLDVREENLDDICWMINPNATCKPRKELEATWSEYLWKRKEIVILEKEIGLVPSYERIFLSTKGKPFKRTWTHPVTEKICPVPHNHMLRLKGKVIAGLTTVDLGVAFMIGRVNKPLGALYLFMSTFNYALADEGDSTWSEGLVKLEKMCNFFTYITDTSIFYKVVAGGCTAFCELFEIGVNDTNWDELDPIIDACVDFQRKVLRFVNNTQGYVNFDEVILMNEEEGARYAPDNWDENGESTRYGPHVKSGGNSMRGLAICQVMFIAVIVIEVLNLSKAGYIMAFLCSSAWVLAMGD